MSAPAHDPAQLLERFGRQLLVPGVELARQAALASRAVVVTLGGIGPNGQAGGPDALPEGAPPIATAAEACLRALAGAGYGRLGFASPLGQPIEAPAGVEWLKDAGNAASLARTATPPLAHVHLAVRPYGASADVLITESKDGWEAGEAHDATVSTVVFDAGAPLAAEDAVAFGALVARLLTEHDLGLEALPASLQLRWPEDGGAPEVSRRAPTEGGAEVAPLAKATLAPGLLAELQATPTVFGAILDHVEREWPDEACGFVLRHDDGRLEAVASRNLQDRYHGVDPVSSWRTSRTAFQLDARLLQRRLDEGAELAVIYHSHSEAGAYFSAEDARAAAPDGEPTHPATRHLVVSVLGGVAKAAAMFAFDGEARCFAAERGSGTLPAGWRRGSHGAAR